MKNRKSSKTQVKRNAKTGEFISQDPSKSSLWSGLSKSKTTRIEKNLRGVMKSRRGEFLSDEISRYKGIRIIED